MVREAVPPPFFTGRFKKCLYICDAGFAKRSSRKVPEGENEPVHDMENTDTYNRWIQEGYPYFSKVGPAAFSIKELSERAGLSRTSFHYYFDNKEDFFDQLIEYHLEEVRKFGQLATRNHTDVTQGIARSMETLSVGTLFHVQLFNHRKVPKGYLVLKVRATGPTASGRMCSRRTKQ